MFATADLANVATPMPVKMLSSGVASIDWIAEQMGHTDGNMIRNHYGTWINERGPDVIGMLEHALKL